MGKLKLPQPKSVRLITVLTAYYAYTNKSFRFSLLKVHITFKQLETNIETYNYFAGQIMRKLNL